MTQHNTTNKKGVTLIEMIVAIAIMSMVMVGFTLLFTRVWTTQGFIIETGIASMIAHRSVGNAVGVIREAKESQAGGFPIVRATTSEFEFYSDYDNDDVVEKVRYFTSGDKLRVGTVEPSGAQPPTYTGANCSGGETCQDVVDFVQNDLDEDPVFTYYDALNVEVVPDSGTGEAAVNGIKLLRILLFVNPDPDSAPNHLKIQSYVHIRNLSNFGDAPT